MLDKDEQKIVISPKLAKYMPRVLQQFKCLINKSLFKLQIILKSSVYTLFWIISKIMSAAEYNIVGFDFRVERSGV